MLSGQKIPSRNKNIHNHDKMSNAGSMNLRDCDEIRLQTVWDYMFYVKNSNTKVYKYLKVLPAPTCLH